MNSRFAILLAGPSLLVLATAAAAQPQPDTQSADPATVAQEVNEAAEATGEEGAIIITARRRAESLLDVPQTVSAVTNKDLQDFNVQNFEDISTLVSGLTLDSDSSGFNATAQTRGIQFQVTSQGGPTMEMYMNEVPVEPNNMFQGQFDVGQIEVLKGPQGTLRGRSAPSGAMTLTTRRPDLNEFGGAVSFVANSHDGMNIQAAVGVPIIQDVLAVRVAGLVLRDDAGGVKSANSEVNPHGETNAIRATLRFEPTDSISAVVMYQRLVRKITDFDDIQFGPGAAGLIGFPGFTRPAMPPTGGTTFFTGGSPALFAPPNFNGPPLTPEDRLNVQDFPGFTRQESDIFTAQLDWRFAGQKLSYVGSYQDFNVLTQGDNDAQNTVVGVERDISRGTHSEEKRKTHELRLSSDERLFGMLDYTAGAFYAKLYGLSATEGRNTLLMPGAFGSPLGTGTPAGAAAAGVLSPFTYRRGYVVGFDNLTPREDIEKSIFASVMLHLFGDTTEISLGGRKIWRETIKEVGPVGIPGLAAVRNPNYVSAATLNAPCPATITGAFTGFGFTNNAPVVGSTYPGTCDVAVNLGNGAPPVTSIIRPIPRTSRKFSPFVWNASISHHVTPDLMVYASYGTAWRAGPGPITAKPVCAAEVTPAALLPAGEDPDQCLKFDFLDPDKSKAIELGFKAALLDRRLNIAVAVFRQKFSALFIRDDGPAITLTGNCVPPYPTQNVQGGCSISGNSVFTFGAPAKTKGIDIDTSFRVSDDLNLGALFSWSKGRFKAGALLPCRDTDLDGIQDSGPTPNNPAAWIAAGGPFGPTLCPSEGEPATFAPPWNATLRGEYSHEIFTGARGFIRALFNYYPKNKNRPDAVSVDTTPVTQRPPKAYGILNLFAGIRAEDGAWEFSVSGRNILNNKTILSRSLDAGTLISPQSGLHFAGNGAGGFVTTQNSGYRTISFVDRREFSVSARFAFGSR